MIFIAEVFFSGCISKVINDGKDFTWDKIKNVINDKNDRNLSTRIYRVIEKILIKITDKNFKDTDVLYEAIEKIFIEFRDNGSTIESVKCGLGMLGSDSSAQRCENFIEEFYDGICQDEELYRRISLILQEKGIDTNQKEVRRLNKTVEYGFDQLNRKVDKIDEKINISNNNEDNLQKGEPVKSRTQEYADKWNANMFLNDFSDWDENAGVNIKLSDVYMEELLPHFIWRNNENESANMRILLSEYISKKNGNKMLVVLGQPGIGKSTLITWTVANYKKNINDVLVYKFASDLNSINWHNTNENHNMFNDILNTLKLSLNDLNGKTLILDGFDEVNIRQNRTEILNRIYVKIRKENKLNNFSLIITCRENYIHNLYGLECVYIILQPWDVKQIDIFCKMFQRYSDIEISDVMKKKLYENRSVFGIPLILYMVLALNILIENQSSIVDIYDQIFSLDGGIYDRCWKNKRYDIPHWTGEIKKQVHLISEELAIWIFENEAEKAFVPQEMYNIIVDKIVGETKECLRDVIYDFKVGSYFREIRHCEGIESDKLSFVHRSIYEYFVAETIYRSIEVSMENITEENQELLIGNIAFYLKKGEITYNIGQYLQHKISKLYNKYYKKEGQRFYLWWETAFDKMIKVGMFYYTKKNIQVYEDIWYKEVNCFFNMIKILRLLRGIGSVKYILEKVNGYVLEKYTKHCIIEYDKCNFNNCCFEQANFTEVNFENSSLRETNLKKSNLERANLKNVDMGGADLRGADLRGAYLKNAIFRNADLNLSIWRKNDIRKIKRQLRSANFENIIIEEWGEQKKINRGELFSDEY